MELMVELSKTKHEIEELMVELRVKSAQRKEDDAFSRVSHLNLHAYVDDPDQSYLLPSLVCVFFIHTGACLLFAVHCRVRTAMLLNLLASVGLLEPWMFVGIFSLTSKKIDLSELQIHATVFVSLICQLVLILLGNRRKYVPGKRIKLFLWVAYNGAEWAATFALTAISYSFSCPEVDKTYTLIMAFWAPFMLVHLGGPDSITALSLEDNELWQRHGLELCTRLFLACLIMYKSWLATPLNILSVLILFMGVLKYGERVWVLWSLSNDQFRKSMLRDPGRKHNEPVLHIPCPPESNIPNADWTAVSLSKLENPSVDATYKVLAWPRPLLRRLYLVPANDKWCNSLSGYNFISSCLIKKPFKSNTLNKLYKMLQSRQYTTSQKDLIYLKMFIFEDLKKKSSQATNFTNCKRLCSQKGEQVLKEWMQFELDDIGDTNGPSYASQIHKTMEVEFDESILLWHIATDLCYHSDLYKNPNIVESRECKASKAFSDYMLYLLLECHHMLPYCIGSKMRYRDTHREAREFFEEQRKLFEGDGQVCNMEMIVRACTSMKFDVKQVPEYEREDKEEEDQSVFFEGCRLARCLLMLRPYEAWEKEKWGMIREVWVEMICYTAINCSFSEHAKQLRQGGELLTHVCLLMTHLGISERFQK